MQLPSIHGLVVVTELLRHQVIDFRATNENVRSERPSVLRTILDDHPGQLKTTITHEHTVGQVSVNPTRHF
jgi:hypothetical protein